jgi:hypothetical protein
MKNYTFMVKFTGMGDNKKEAWENALENASLEELTDEDIVIDYLEDENGNELPMEQ